MIDLKVYFLSMGAMAGLVTVITGYLNTHVSFLEKANKFWRQFSAWAVSIALAFVGAWFSYGITSGLDLGMILLTGLFVGFVANGIFDIAIVQSVLEAIKARKKPAVTPTTTG